MSPIGSTRLREGPTVPAATRARRERRRAEAEGQAASGGTLGRLASLSTIGLFAGLAVYAAAAGATLFGPFFLALVVGLVFGPLLGWLRRHRVPETVGALLVLVLLVGAGWALYASFEGPVREWTARGPEMVEAARGHLAALEGALARARDVGGTVGGLTGAASGAEGRVEVVDADDGFFTTVLSAGGSFAGQVVIFVGTLFFYLANRSALRRILLGAAPTHGRRLALARILRDVEYFLSRYFGTVALINLGLALVTYAVMLAIGFPAPALVGLLAGCLNFIPYVGPIVVGAIIMGISLVDAPTLLAAIVPTLVFIGIQTVEGNVVTPSLVGRSLSLNPFFVFVSVAAWMWLWGPLGAFLASPFLVVAYITMVHTVDRIDASWIAKGRREALTRKVGETVETAGEAVTEGASEVRERIVSITGGEGEMADHKAGERS